MKLSNTLLFFLFIAPFSITYSKAQEDNFYPKCFVGAAFNDESIESSCNNFIFQDFAQMSTANLYDFLINLSTDNTCFERKVFSYNAAYSPDLFSTNKINYIADQATNLANNFNGTNNGLFGLFQYLRVAVKQNYTSLGNTNFELPIPQPSWDKIKLACVTLASNTHILNTQTDDANMIAGYLFATCRANNIPGEDAILNLVQTTLHQFAELQNWKGFINENGEYAHSYYFKNHFLLNTFFFYAIIDEFDEQNPKFAERLIEDPYYKIIASLAFLACDPDIKNNNNTRLSETSLFGVKKLDILSTAIKEDQNTALYNAYLENALIKVFRCNDYLDPIWVTTAKALLDGGTDIGYELDAIRASLIEQQFPNQNVFEDCKLIIYSSLTNEEVSALYESLQQVKAQFFRLFELNEQMPVDGDPNEVVQIRIFNSGNSYRSYNGFLFNAPSAGGGVFIEDATRINEDYATMYTYERSFNESAYSLEEIVRHEYMHYLQARYLIKGLWGKDVNPFYDANRLVWFEEGMAEFFSGSSGTNGVIDRTVIKNNIANRNTIDIQQITQLGYGSPDVYNFGNLVWSNWYKNNRCRFKQLANFTQDGTNSIQAFDNFLQNAALNDNQSFQNHVNCIKNNGCPVWIPNTELVQFSTSNLNTIKNEFIANINGVESVEIEEIFSSDVPRFQLTGNFSANIGSDVCQNNVNLSNELDDILIEIKNETNLTNFDYATAYFNNENTNINGQTNCNQYSGQIFYTSCNGLTYFLIQQTNGTILDPYNADGINFDYPDGATINFNYTDYSTGDLCALADKAVLITCVEVTENVNGKAFFNIKGPLKESKTVWPGDVNYDGVVNGTDVMHLGHYLNQSNTPANNISIDWQPKNRSNWDTNQTADFCYFGFKDLKHADCNGDGIINTTDLNAIEQNWFNTHSNITCIQPSIPCFYTNLDYQLLLQPIGILNNNNVVVNIVVERKSNELLNILSGFVNVDYSDNISTAQINFDNTWLGTPNSDLKYLFAEDTTIDRLEAGFTKTNNSNSFGSGILATLVFQIEPNNNSNIELFVELGFQNKAADNFYLNKAYTIQTPQDLACYNELIISETTPFQNEYNSSNLIETNGDLTIGKDQVVKYKAKNRVRLNTGFGIKAGASFNANTEPCGAK